MEEVSAKTQMARIRTFERRFIATHLINIGTKVAIFEVLNKEKDLASKLSLWQLLLIWYNIWPTTIYCGSLAYFKCCDN